MKDQSRGRGHRERKNTGDGKKGRKKSRVGKEVWGMKSQSQIFTFIS